MQDQALIWNADHQLQVTSLTARLRDLANVGSITRALTVSDLWGCDDPLGVPVVAHHWALAGESLAFDALVHGVNYHFELEPLHDIDGRVIGVGGRACEALAEAAHARHAAIGEAERTAGVGTWYEDLRTGVTTISEGLANLLGIARNVTTFDIRAFDHPQDRESIKRAIADQREDASYTCDHRILCFGSRMRAVRERARMLFDERGVAIARIGTLVDVSDFKEREAELSELAHYDLLTHLPNRALLEERLAASVARSERHGLHNAVLFIDLDQFKAVNDTYGHSFGDRLLASVGDRLTRHVRASDTVSRLGGDEFVVLIEDLFSDEAAVDAARKILRSFDEAFSIDDRRVTLGASIGIATFPHSARTPRELIDAADREMYVVKRNGGCGIKLAHPEEESALRATEKAVCPQVHSSPEHRHFATRQSA